MGDLLGSFPESMRVRSKHAEKTRVGLWGQSIIPKSVWGVTKWYQSQTSPSTMWFEDEPCGSWWACNTRGRRKRGVVAPHGTTKAEEGKVGRHIGMRGILRLCREETAWLKEIL